MKIKLLNILFFVMIFVIGFGNSCECNVLDLTTIKHEYYFNDDYTFSSDTTDEEIIQYYLTNGIAPTSVSPEKSERITNDTIIEHLVKRFGGVNWIKNNSLSFDVSGLSGKNPIPSDEDDENIVVAKELANYDYNDVGCGALALCTQFDYLSRGMDYFEFGYDMDRSQDKRQLVKDILSNIYGFSSDSWIGQAFNAPDGTFIFPNSVVNCAKKVLTKNGLMIKKTKINDLGNEVEYYDDDSQIVVHGDNRINCDPKNVRISKIKESIDKGMPVIWWTLPGIGFYDNHYMNIYGYDVYDCYDNDASVSDHLLFKLCCNWGENQDFYYVDSDIFDVFGMCGFIFFEEIGEHNGFLDADFDFDCSYNNSPIFKTISKKGMNIITKRLRTGLVNHFSGDEIDGKRLTMSSRRNSFNVSYLRFGFEHSIKSFFFGINRWSTNEFGVTGAKMLIIFRTVTDEWAEEIDVSKISSVHGYPSTFKYNFFDKSVVEVELHITSLSVGGDRNKGRIYLSGISVALDKYYSDINGPIYEF